MWITKDELSKHPKITIGKWATYFATSNRITLGMVSKENTKLYETCTEHFLNHEILHWILLKIVGYKASSMLDDVRYEVEASWNMPSIGWFA